MNAKEIAKHYDNNPRWVFNIMIDAIVACGQEYIPLAVALELAGLEIIVNHTGENDV